VLDGLFIPYSHNKCLKIPPPSSNHFAARVRRSRVVRQTFDITPLKILTIPTESPSRHTHTHTHMQVFYQSVCKSSHLSVKLVIFIVQRQNQN
jgi:hypothetical protein